MSYETDSARERAIAHGDLYEVASVEDARRLLDDIEPNGVIEDRERAIFEDYLWRTAEDGLATREDVEAALEAAGEDPQDYA